MDLDKVEKVISFFNDNSDSMSSALTSNEVISSFIWGGAGVLLYLFPYAYYIKRFYILRDAGDGKSYFEIITTAFSMQITMMCLVSFVAFFSNQMTASGTSYDAKRAIRIFFTGNSSATSISSADMRLWDIWKPLADVEISSSITKSGEKGITIGITIMIYYTAILLKFALLGLSLAFIFFPIIYYLRQSSDDKQRSSIIEKVSNTFLLMFGIFAINHVHQAIASGYVTVFAEIQGFSFHAMMQEVWKEIFL